METTIKEMRAFPRAPVNTAVIYRLLRDFRNRTCACGPQTARTMDASAGGLRILTQERLPLNYTVEVILDLFHDNQPRAFQGKVVRSAAARENGFFESGLTFSGISSAEQQSLNERIQQTLLLRGNNQEGFLTRFVHSIEAFLARFTRVA